MLHVHPDFGKSVRRYLKRKERKEMEHWEGRTKIARRDLNDSLHGLEEAEPTAKRRQQMDLLQPITNGVKLIAAIVWDCQI